MQLSTRIATFASYAIRGLRASHKKCPNCGQTGPVIIRKYLVATLRRCANCQLQFRAPTDSQEESVDFYQEAYQEGTTTELPDPASLDELKRTGFPDLACSYAEYIRVLRQLPLPDNARLFDFGCSWGYGSYQLAQAGYRVKSFEISRGRAQFGRDNLGVDLVEDFDRFVADNESSFDIFFSAHVLEHVPSPSAVIAAAFRLLRPGGVFVGFFPNGSDNYRKANFTGWQSSWGKVHPSLLDDRYFDAALKGRTGILATTPVDISKSQLAAIGRQSGKLVRNDPLDRPELFVLAMN